MALQMYSCTNCGHWQRWFAEPASCPVCTDVRNAVPEDGWCFRSAPDVAARSTTVWSDVAPGVTGYTVRPQLGLGTTGWVIDTPQGQVAWEGAGHYSPAALDHLRQRGGLYAAASSHVHGYGALWQLQDELQPPVVAVGVEDLAWTKAFRVTWPTDARHELADGLTMYRTGGHFPGHAVLHDEARRILFVGDLIKVDLDGTVPVALSSHKAYHAQIPLSHDEIRAARAVVAPLDFTAVATPFEYAAPVSTAQVLALFDRLLAGPPIASPVALDDLC